MTNIAEVFELGKFVHDTYCDTLITMGESCKKIDAHMSKIPAPCFMRECARGMLGALREMYDAPREMRERVEWAIAELSYALGEHPAGCCDQCACAQMPTEEESAALRAQMHAIFSAPRPSPPPSRAIYADLGKRAANLFTLDDVAQFCEAYARIYSRLGDDRIKAIIGADDLESTDALMLVLLSLVNHPEAQELPEMLRAGKRSMVCGILVLMIADGVDIEQDALAMLLQILL